MVEDAPPISCTTSPRAACSARTTLGRPVIGERRRCAAQTATSRSYHRAAYGAGNIVVAAAGNVEHDALSARSSPAPAAGRGRRAAVRSTGRSSPAAGGVPGARHRAVPRLRLGARACRATTIGSRSPCWTSCSAARPRRGCSRRSASDGAWPTGSTATLDYAESGQVGVYVGTRPDNLEECLSIVRSETTALAAGDLRRRARAREGDLTGRLFLALESTSSRMSRLGSACSAAPRSCRSTRSPRGSRPSRRSRSRRSHRGCWRPSTSRPPASAPTRASSTPPSEAVALLSRRRDRVAVAGATGARAGPSPTGSQPPATWSRRPHRAEPGGEGSGATAARRGARRASRRRGRRLHPPGAPRGAARCSRW